MQFARSQFACLPAIAICLACSLAPLRAASAASIQQKELNFVLLHGLGATSASMQSLADAIGQRAESFISSFEQATPGTLIRVNTLLRSYPNTVDISTWANNIADTVRSQFAGRRNLIFVGHSMGGKAALYAVAHNTQGIGDLATMVVTVNSPIKDLDAYHIVGGGTVTDYIRRTRVISDQGAAESLATYDSSGDGLRVASDKHWLALISAESAPLSAQFQYAGVDPYPQDMDDGLVPVSAQYADGADVVYYGEHGHSDFSTDPDLTAMVADQILRYIFGGTIETSAPGSGGTFEHHAGLLPFTYRWDDRLGETLSTSGTVEHANASFFKWQTWEDAVGALAPGDLPASFAVKVTSFPFLTWLSQARWANPDGPAAGALYVKTGAAPRFRIAARWRILGHTPLPDGVRRDRYEIKITEGTPVVGIYQASWLTNDAQDVRLMATSRAEGPFRWYKAEFRTYYQKPMQRRVIDEMSPQP